MVNDVIKIAISQLQVQEEPKGSNWGKDVQKYLNSVGLNFPAAWCMAFVYWCYNEYYKAAAAKNPLIKTGGVLAQWNKIGKEYKFTSNPAAGDIFIMKFKNGLGHAGLVEFVDDKGILHTIEGNTNDEGVRDGFEVCRRTRMQPTIFGYIRTIKTT